MTSGIATKSVTRLGVWLAVCSTCVSALHGAEAIQYGDVDPDAIRVLLSPGLETILMAPMQGSLVALHASLGSSVEEGQTIVHLDCTEPAARLQMAEAEYHSARESLAVKSRLRELNAAGDMEVVLAQAEVDRGKASVALTRAQMEKCTVKAPFSGRVAKVHVKPFQGVEAGAPLVELVSTGPLKLRLNVPSRLLSVLSEGTQFSVWIDETGRQYQARVTAMNARVDAVARTIELVAELLESHADLLPGMSGIARFDLDSDA